jgi:integrase
MTKRLIKSKFIFHDPNFSTIKIQELIDVYFDVYCEDENIKSWRTSLYNARPLEKFFGDQTVQNINSLAIMQYKKERRKVVCNNTLRRELTVLQSVLNRGIDYDLLKQADIDHIESLKISKYKPRAQFRKVMPGFAEVNSIFKLLPSHIYDVMFAVHRTAYRKGELFSLTFSDIKFDERVLELSDSKNNEGRTTPLYKEIYDHFQRLHEDAKKAFNRNNVNDVSVFREPDRITPMNPFNVYRPWRNACIKANCITKDGKHKFNAHDIRKAAIKFLLQEMKFDRYMIMQCYSGHKDDKIFETVYNLSTPEDMQHYYDIAMNA